MSVRDLLPWRDVLPPPVIRIDPFTPVYDFKPLGDSEGRAPWRGGNQPLDPVVFGPPYTPRRETTPGHWRAWRCACGAMWHSDGETPCWACDAIETDD